MRGTTPKFVLITQERLIDLVNAQDVVVSIRSGGNTVNLHKDDLEQVTNGKIVFRLTQEQTLALQARARMQVRALLENGDAVASGIIEFSTGNVLYDAVLGDDDDEDDDEEGGTNGGE